MSTALHTATPESVRAVNRLILLNLARRFQPISRAELSRRSGIFPSSVSRIVEGLIEEGILTEEKAIPSGRGKVPTLLRIRDDYYQVLGIHIRPSETTIAHAGFGAHIHRTWSFATPSDPTEFVRAAAGKIREISATVSGAIRGIGIAAPGFVDAAEGRITCVSALLAYSGYPLAGELAAACGLPVSLDNDCNLGALSELKRLEGRDEEAPRDFLFLSIGDSGVGAGLVLGGELYRGHDLRFAAEVGHMIIETGGPPCSCGRRGCLETFVSNRATWKRYRPGTPYSRVRFRSLLRKAGDGVPDAAAAVSETVRAIALACTNLTSVLNPAEIVIAGEIAEVFPAIAEASERLYGSPYAKVRLRRSWLRRDVPLLHGAVCLALSAAMPAPSFGPAPTQRLAAAMGAGLGCTASPPAFIRHKERL